MHLTPHGGEVFDSNWRAAFNNPAGVKSAEILKEVVDTGPPGIPSFGFGEMQNAFLQGKAAFYLDSVSVFGPAQDPTKSRVAGKVGYALHPKGTRHSAQSGGFSLAMPKNARNKDAAFLFMQWMTSKQADLKIALAGGNIDPTGHHGEPGRGGEVSGRARRAARLARDLQPGLAAADPRVGPHQPADPGPGAARRDHGTAAGETGARRAASRRPRTSCARAAG